MNANFVCYSFFLTLCVRFFLIYCNYCCAKTGRSSSWVLFRDCSHGSNKAKLKRLNTCWPILLCEIHFTAKFPHKLYDDSTSTNSNGFFSLGLLVEKEKHKYKCKNRQVFSIGQLKFCRSASRCGCWRMICRYFQLNESDEYICNKLTWYFFSVRLLFTN